MQRSGIAGKPLAANACRLKPDDAGPSATQSDLAPAR
jgi:hypothetical protein